MVTCSKKNVRGIYLKKLEYLNTCIWKHGRAPDKRGY